jgi:SWIB-domain-containing proteins implicated in chromatin remodeling
MAPKTRSSQTVSKKNLLKLAQQLEECVKSDRKVLCDVMKMVRKITHTHSTGTLVVNGGLEVSPAQKSCKRKFDVSEERPAKKQKSEETKEEKKEYSGFNRPYTLSPEMYEFTGWNPNNKYSRTEVTRFMFQYIKDHNLQDPKDRSNIVPDLKLQNLLKYDPKNIPVGDVMVYEKNERVKKVVKGPLVLNYFRLQKYLQPHYVKE